MRMPDKTYYSDADLNRGYIFTNLKEFALEKQFEKYYVPEDLGYLQDKLYQPIRLKSIHIKRQRALTRFSADFYDIFMKNPKINKKMKSLSKTSTKISSKIIQGKIKPEHYGIEDDIETIETIESLASPDEINEHLEKQIEEWCKPYQKTRSEEHLERSLLDSIEKNLKIDWKNHSEKAQKIILSGKNKIPITECTDIAKEKYSEKQKKQSASKPTVYDFEILENGNKHISHKGGTKSIITKDVSKSIVKPLYDTFQNSKPERAFYKKLDQSKNVIWWYKNGYGEPLYFATKYKWEKKWKRFFPDYIIQWKDGTVGIYDTKGGEQTETPKTKAKAKALAAHIKKENPKRQKFKYKNKEQKLEGGIIAITAKDTTTGTWKINKDAKQPFSESKISDWDDFIRF